MIPLFIPYVNRPDLLRKAVDSVDGNRSVIVEIINNSGRTLPDEFKGLTVWEPIVPLTFAQTQNAILRKAVGLLRTDSNHPVKHPFYLFMHGDAEAGEGVIDKLIEMANKRTQDTDKWSVIFTNYDALAAFNTQAFRAVGGWDQNLPQYFSDNDMYLRLRLAGYKTFDSGLPVKHEPSQTIKSDGFLNYVNGLTFPIFGRYFADKWGGSPGSEKFDKPFNGSFNKE